MASAFLCLVKKFLPTQGPEDILLCYLLEALSFNLSHLDFHSVWNWFLGKVYKVGQDLFFSLHGYLIELATFIENNIHFPHCFARFPLL